MTRMDKDPRFEPGGRWDVETADPAWAGRVLEAVDRNLAGVAGDVDVHSVSVEAGVLLAVYSLRPGPVGRYGLRRALTAPPSVGLPEGDLAEWLAAWIVAVEIVPPPGRVRMETIDGVRWRSEPATDPDTYFGWDYKRSAAIPRFISD